MAIAASYVQCGQLNALSSAMRVNSTSSSLAFVVQYVSSALVGGQAARALRAAKSHAAIVRRAISWLVSSPGGFLAIVYNEGECRNARVGRHGRQNEYQVRY